MSLPGQCARLVAKRPVLPSHFDDRVAFGELIRGENVDLLLDLRSVPGDTADFGAESRGLVSSTRW